MLDVSIHAPVKVRQYNNSETVGYILVSIHAPVKVRQTVSTGVLVSLVSIHAPVKVRPLPLLVIDELGGFNSRTREGATRSVLGLLESIWFQFTHP